jgi:hypothetical protein
VADFELGLLPSRREPRNLLFIYLFCPWVSEWIAVERRRVKHTFSFEKRLAEEAKRLREQAENLPPRIERDELIRKARQIEIATGMNERLTSPGLQPPR